MKSILCNLFHLKVIKRKTVFFFNLPFWVSAYILLPSNLLGGKISLNGAENSPPEDFWEITLDKEKQVNSTQTEI